MQNARSQWPLHRRRHSYAVILAATVLAISVPRSDAAPPDDVPPMARKAKGFDLSLLAPVDGITLRQLGRASYYFGCVPDLTKDQVLDKVGIDKSHYEGAEKVFTQRMIDDKTFTITSLFGAYAEEVAQ